ncbi:sensor histidine kinase [Microvirga sp. M2]|uniref:sensor histidine kinase n=1 Tax=Microvirga sp. M2 TaxID=3073270 RepID=UPI0039C132C4
MKQGSLRLRLFAAGSASIVVALAIAGIALFLLFERHVERRTVVELEAHLRQLVSGLERTPDGSLQVGRPPAEPRFQEPLSGLYWQIAVEPDGPVLRSRSLWDTRLALAEDVLAPGAIHEHTVAGPGGSPLLAVEREVSLPASLRGGNVRVSVAISRTEIRAASWDFASDLVPSLVVLGVFLTVAAWLQVSVGLRPLDAVRRRLAAIRTGGEARLGEDFPDEVRPLAKEVDHLLDAQEKAVAQARARAGDLAHGLKTPLTVLMADAEELRARGETEIATEIAMLADGMRRHVERELARARTGHRTYAGKPRPLRPTLDQVVEVVRRTTRGQRLQWKLDVGDDLTSSVDPQDLAEMLGNIVENAAQWSHHRIEISGRQDGGAVVLSIADDGPGIPETGIETALIRGGRLDESKPGSGLGLAIAGDLAEAYGGSLSLSRSALGGLQVDLRLPQSR